MTKLFILFGLLAITLASHSHSHELSSLWSSWKQHHGKSYSLSEDLTRFAIFVENHRRISAFNSKSTSAKQALNKFADLTSDEFKNLYSNSFVQTMEVNQTISNTDASDADLPASVDWRTKGAVSPVQNSGECGADWPFVAAGALEGLYFVDNGEFVALSEQMLIDCVKANQGCSGGGSVGQAFAYTASHGIETDADYPYNEKTGSCKYNKTRAIRVNSGFEWIPFNDATALKSALVKQPVAVQVQADQNVFQFYSSGVITSDCGASVDHEMLCVGYETIEGAEGFIVKNTWGSDWGAQGYAYISTDGSANDGEGVCGILTRPIVPTK